MRQFPHLPRPHHTHSFHLLRKGIYDCPDTEVFVNEEEDFAFLHPIPKVDYGKYKSRVGKINLEDYKRKLGPFEQRLSFVKPLLRDGLAIIELGCGDASFLKMLGDAFPHAELAGYEPDISTAAGREEFKRARFFKSEEDLVSEGGGQFDIVCFFHVFEHISDPSAFLAQCRKILKPKGQILLEIPCLHDPLRTLYRSSAYEDFFFQAQHPYYYSKASLERVLSANGFTQIKVFPFQRYSLENHLGWLLNNKPGGLQLDRNLFSAETSESYSRDLVAVEMTDTLFALATSPT